MIEFFTEFDPPRTTQQRHRISYAGGHPVFYDGDSLKAAKKTLAVVLSTHRPREPMQGPVELTVEWRFRATKPHKDREWKVTRPDTDNLDKLIKDVMSQLGYWKDDAQVVREVIEKWWAATPGLYVKVRELEKFKE